MNKVITICGPTASGKTSFAIKLALQLKHLNPVIINADSIQLFKDIEVISAAPSIKDKQIIPHELYGILKPTDYFSVADYVSTAAKLINELIKKGSLPIIVGGTGMYINSLMFGYSPIPDIPAEIRASARLKLEAEGNEAFFAELVQLDPLIKDKLYAGDSQRILRAYEVIKTSGKSIIEFHSLPPIQPLENVDFKVIMLDPERSLLYQNCNDRFHQLLSKSALKEVERLLNQNLDRKLQIFKALGVSELIDYLESRTSLDEAINLAQIKTRQYAKRQVTWFKHQIKDKEVLSYSTLEEFKERILTHKIN